MRKKLGELARVFRCTLPREEVEAPATPIAWKRGHIPVWHNIRLEDIDPDTGFIREDNLMAVKPQASPGICAIEPGDILFCFQGVGSRVGQAAMLLHELAAIPGRTLAIIRPEAGCDPIWLYHRLRQLNVDRELQPQLSGRKAFLHFLKLRELEFDMPSDREVEEVNLLHKKLVADYLAWTAAMKHGQKKIRELVRRGGVFLDLPE